MAVIAGIRTVKKGERLYDIVYGILIVQEAIARALYSVLNVPFPLDPGGSVDVHCTKANLMVRMPGTQAFHAGLRDIEPDGIEFHFTRLPAEEPKFSVWAAGLRPSPPFWENTQVITKVIIRAFSPSFVEYYENHRDWIAARSGKPQSWPITWQFGRIIRNALAHGGIDIRDRIDQPVTWKGVTYGKAENGRRIWDDFSVGDIICLIFEMDDDLTAFGCR